MGARYTWSYAYGPAPPRRGMSFSARELRELIFAVTGLSLALVVLNLVPNLTGRSSFGGSDPATAIAFVFVAAFVSVGTGVGLHEIAHKAVAQSYGHWAEFRWDPRGIAMAFLFALFGFIFGAPGATIVGGPVTRSENGKISGAGPATNLGLALGFLVGGVALRASGGAVGLMGLILQFGAFMNLILAGFNMIPVLPFDGAKVWAWNKVAYAALLGAILAVLAWAFVLRLLPI